MAEVHHERREDVAILTMDRPVANALTPSLRSELVSRLDAANADPETRSVVLQGGGAVFSSGVDIPEYDGGIQTPWVSDLCQYIEDSPKPVVAALHGVALGGGFELALATHHRVAAHGTCVALPEVTLGLIPGGGATQRVPRLIGARAALELMMTGQAVDVADPRLERIIDQITPDDPLEAAIAAARALAQAGTWRRSCDQSTGFDDAKEFQGAVRAVLDQVPNADSAEAEIARCVEAALLLPFVRGLAFERAAFEDRLTAPQSRARRYAYAAERRSMIMPEKASGQPAVIRDVALLGEGDLVIELAIACLDAGLRVALAAGNASAGDACRDLIDDAYTGSMARNRLSADERDARMARLTSGGLAEAVVGADLVLDTGQLALDERLGALKDTAVWAMLTGDVAAGFDPPDETAFDGRCVGLRVHRPAHSAKLVEISVAPGTQADAVVTLSALFSAMGRVAIRCLPVPGLIGNNMSAAFYQAALVLAEAGADPYKVDAAARSLGFGAGPFQMIDREGLPYLAGWLGRRATLRDQPPPPETGLLARRIQAGAKGRTTRYGFYVYDAEGAHHDPRLNTGNGPAAAFSATDLMAALEAAMVNEAAHLLALGVVQRASDIDVVMIKGYGFDAARGGPLFQADLSGIFTVLKHMNRFSEVSAPIWSPHPLIQEMVKYGRGFFDRSA